MSDQETPDRGKRDSSQRIMEALRASESGVALGGRLSSTDGRTVVLRNRSLLAALAQSIQLADYRGDGCAAVQRMIDQFRPDEGELCNIALWGIGGTDLRAAALIDLVIEGCSELKAALAAAADGGPQALPPTLAERARVAAERLCGDEAARAARQLAALLELADERLGELLRRAAAQSTAESTPAVYRAGRMSPDILARELRNARDTLMYRDLERFSGVRSAANTVRRILSRDAPLDSEDGRVTRAACLALLDLADAVVAAPGINLEFDRLRGGPLGLAMSTVERLSSTKTLITEARQARMEPGQDEDQEAA